MIVAQRRGDSDGDDSPLCTMDGSIVGTPAYMPPEQAAGTIDEVDQASDIYSLGAILYNLLTGVAPHCDGDHRLSPQAVLLKVLKSEPTPVGSLNPYAAPELIAICDKAMARDKSRRYPTAELLAEDLQAYLDGRVVGAYQSGALAEFRSWIRRNKGWAATMASALLLALCGLLAFGIFQRSARHQIAREHYYGNIMAAERFIDNGQTDRAQKLLLQTDSSYRNWEWGRLLYQCNQSMLTWDATDGGGELRGLGVNADGTRVYTLDNRQVIKLWDASTGEELLATERSAGRVALAAFNTDGELLAASTSSGKLLLWDSKDGTSRKCPEVNYPRSNTLNFIRHTIG